MVVIAAMDDLVTRLDRAVMAAIAGEANAVGGVLLSPLPHARGSASMMNSCAGTVPSLCPLLMADLPIKLG